MISGITDPSNTHADLTNSTTYYYVVRTVGTGGVESQPSTEVSATPFVPEVPIHALTVTLAGTGTGAITSTPSGINSGSTCSASFDDNQESDLNGTSVQQLDFYRLVGSLQWYDLCGNPEPGAQCHSNLLHRIVNRRFDDLLEDPSVTPVLKVTPVKTFKSSEPVAGYQIIQSMLLS